MIGRALPAALLAALVALTLAGAAHAQSTTLVGRWAFQTAKHPRMDCTIAGVADFSPGASAGTFSVILHAQQTCAGEDRVVTALEACVAQQRARDVQLTCRLIRSSSEYYIADNFTLHLDAADLMTGRLDDDRSWDVPVRFDRNGEGPLIS